jgi:hypothetical protein
MAHPSSGIVVTERGEMLFVHSGRGLAKLNQASKLTYVHQSTGGHWLCLYPQGSFSRTQSSQNQFDISPNPLPVTVERAETSRCDAWLLMPVNFQPGSSGSGLNLAGLLRILGA